ncbi:MAG: hypothetical protein JWM25_678 [Thermoleophilia bacterium]|nr:hypothetical protein [Thermoleophilia bacterium]
MARTTPSIDVETIPDAPTALADGFGAEFRELARQRRFTRAAKPVPSEVAWQTTDLASTTLPPVHPSATPAATRPAPMPAAAPGRPRHTVDDIARHAARFAASVTQASEATPMPASTPPIAAARTAPTRTATPRISDDAAVMLAELSRMSDRLVESRELLAGERLRADYAEAQLAAANDRMMAARALVHEAQRATRESADRAAWLEGRNETLQEALHLAVNSSILSRWRWRRQLRQADSAI